MATKSLLTASSQLYNVENLYYSPSAIVPPYYNNADSIYCFLSQVDPWDDDNNPPVPTQDQRSLKQVARNIFAVKRVTSGDISPVVQRINWESGTIYSAYSDTVDMYQTDENGFLVRNFYALNRYGQIFKCLWNGSQEGEPSTDEPYFEPGSYGTNNIYQGPNDDYKWKYIYTVENALKIKFMDDSWMPIPIGAGYIPNPLINPRNYTSNPGVGNIDVVNVLSTGSGYNENLSAVSVVITGDGTGAAATANVTNGQILDVVVTNPGTNYTYANAAIVSSVGSGATLSAPVSPIGGHGLDPISELGCKHVMITSQFNGSESGYIPTDITYHQVGLLINPVSTISSPDNANGEIYSTTTDFIVAPGFGLYNNGEVIYQGDSFAESTFSATIVSFDPGTNVIKTINTLGTPVINLGIVGKDSLCTRTVLSYGTPSLITQSGYLAFVENRSGIQRSYDGIEQFKIVLGY